MLVSFIIPAYNAADTIERCLDSICNLTLNKKDYEIIVIDDASIDNTVSVIGNWKSENEECELEILRQPENHRQGAARNRGVSVAKGKYICFVDADDAVTEEIVKAICSAADNKTDMTAYHYAFVNENGLITKEADRLSFEEGQLFSGIEMQNRHSYWCSGPVAYVYNRAFLERVNYPFEEGVLFEDSDFVAVHLYHAKRMTYSAELGYKAYYREGSTTRHISYKNVADYMMLGDRMLKFYERINDAEIGELNDEDKQFVEGILEGGCWNIAKACKQLVKLNSIEEVYACYNRIDASIDRETLCGDKGLHTYFWNLWTYICLKYKKIAILILMFLIPTYKMLRR